ncbi:MAG: DUF1614 domain-containing protein [Candidatus Bathyarchaeia archaeon]|nr:DUF1614 domain-containing protein [Candidatus Bathyarchaeota archaeon]
MLILFLTILLIPWLILTGSIFMKLLHIPPLFTLIIFIASLFGSYINIPIKEVSSFEPIITAKEITFFGVRWFIPDFNIIHKRTVIALNVGGAFIPLLISFYLLIFIIPKLEVNPLITYIKTFTALIIVALVIHVIATPVKGLGIATPAFLPPFITALTSFLLYKLYIPSNPFIMAYISGTLGILIGADLMNLNKIPKLGASIVSIGGAGTFDGIYLTGLMAVFLTLLLI